MAGTYGPMQAAPQLTELTCRYPDGVPLALADGLLVLLIIAVWAASRSYPALAVLMTLEIPLAVWAAERLTAWVKADLTDISAGSVFRSVAVPYSADTTLEVIIDGRRESMRIRSGKRARLRIFGSLRDYDTLRNFLRQRVIDAGGVIKTRDVAEKL